MAPQQPPPAARTSEMSMRSSARASAASIDGASAGCTQPSSTSMRREWRCFGQDFPRDARGTFAASAPGRNGRARRPASRAEQTPMREPLAQQPARRTLARAALDLLLDDQTADVDQATVAHAGGTRRLAAAAGQAAIEVQLRARGHVRAFEHLLDEVDASARPVEFVAEQLIGRAGCRAKTAMHAGAQDRIGFTPLGRILDEIGEPGFHARPWLRTPRTSGAG